MNTLEWMPVVLPALWLFAVYVSDWLAASIGLVWIAGRILYLIGYSRAAEKRGPGFGIQALAGLVLLLGALRLKTGLTGHRAVSAKRRHHSQSTQEGAPTRPP